ncbi:MAG: hypothetical protein A2046_08145 [Bacteroidetes bacterium GWA2_30_7]|nr:MAG: hypothetical protein A2046_08145 [Bacteroidetes bacterium GWA2_30_7]
MKSHYRLKNNKILYFSRWSRKKYAILASLSKVVHIGKLTVNIANCSLNKLEKSITVLSNSSENHYDELFDVIFKESTVNNIFSTQLIPINVNSKNDKFLY